MPTSNTPSVANLKRAIEIAEQIEKLQSQLASLVGGTAPVVSAPRAAATSPAPAKRGGKSGKRSLSPEARERIAAAQRARWAKSKGGTKAAPAAPAAAKPAKPAKKKGGLTPAGRAKLAAAMKARWAARKKGSAAPNAAKK
ncbi:MAG: hypothetical protein WCF18_21860 [Chthoniobacteraceae bacterium]